MHGRTGPIGNREIRLPAAWRVWKPQASDTVGSTSRVRHRLGLLPYANDVDATFGSPMRLLDETGFWAVRATFASPWRPATPSQDRR